MTLARRALLSLPLLGVVLVPGARSVAATPVLDGLPITVEQAVAQKCFTRLLPGAPGTLQTPYVATDDGWVSAKVDGADGDWDLAVFDTATGLKLAASSSAGAEGLVDVPVKKGGALTVQTCRRSGASEAAGLTIDITPAATPKGLPPQVVDVAIDDSKEGARLAELGFDVTHDVTDTSAEVVATAEERRRLRALGYEYEVEVASLPDLYAAAARQDARAARGSQARALPSGRTTYRQYEDYGQDLKDLIARNPGHTKAVSLGSSLDGRPIEGVEITKGVGSPSDGRPIFVLGGVTHAREWPSGDTSMEFAIDLADSFRLGSDPRVTRLLETTRVFVIPLQNPDGFVVSRQAGAAFASGDDTPEALNLGMAAADSGAYKRKNCRASSAALMALPCAMRGPNGVDLNRAYGAYWGGDGSSSDSTTQQYRGLAPFTEPEAQAIRRFGAAHQIQTYITQHTHTEEGLWLRQPGFNVEGDEVPPAFNVPTANDEAKMAALGDAMGEATGYRSELGYKTLGNITGPADDFLYYSQGTFGYTPELRSPTFHGSYANDVVSEYAGEGAKAGRGLREADLLAGEQAANKADHLVVRGTAPAGRVLRLKKVETLKTTIVPEGDTDVLFDETLDTVLTVPASGAYEWHVNPSTRPLLERRSEAFTFTCETPDGTVLERGELRGERGEVVTRNFSCLAGGSAVGGTQAGTPSAPGIPTPGVQPVKPVAATKITILRPKFSARRTTRLGGLKLYLRLQGGPLRNVRATIKTPAGKVLLSGRAVTLPRSGRVPLKRRAKLTPGAVRVSVTGIDANGKRITATLRSRLVR